MEFIDSYMDVFRVVLAYMFAVGGGVGIMAMVSVITSSALYGLWVLIIKALRIKNPPSYTKPFTVFAIVSIALFLPLGYATYASINTQFQHLATERAYDKGWVYKEVRAERFMLVHIDPPKHTYVTIKHMLTGTLYERMHVGKHCNGWDTNKVGDVMTIKYKYFVHKNTGATKIEFENLHDVFC